MCFCSSGLPALWRSKYCCQWSYILTADQIFLGIRTSMSTAAEYSSQSVTLSTWSGDAWFTLIKIPRYYKLRYTVQRYIDLSHFFSSHNIFGYLLVFAARCGVSVCLGVCLSVTFVHSVNTNKVNFKFFSPSGSHTILVFPHQTLWQYSDGNTPKVGVECRWGRQKSRFWVRFTAAYN